LTHVPSRGGRPDSSRIALDPKPLAVLDIDYLSIVVGRLIIL
jgi:hypothetical protein